MKSFKIIITMMVLSMIVGVLGSNQTYAATSSLTTGTTGEVCKAGDDATKTTCKKSETLSKKIETVVKTLSGLVGAFAVGMIVYGGFKYITSQGDPRQAEAAKNIIWYAGVGLFIVLVAFIIFDLVASAIAG